MKNGKLLKTIKFFKKIRIEISFENISYCPWRDVVGFRVEHAVHLAAAAVLMCKIESGSIDAFTSYHTQKKKPESVVPSGAIAS